MRQSSHVKGCAWKRTTTRMEVFAITIFMSLALATLFAVLCYAERCQRLRRPTEQDALLPLDTDAKTCNPRHCGNPCSTCRP